MCSLSVLATGAVTLSALLAAKPAHATEEITGAYAVFGEIVAVVPAGTSSARLEQAAANSGCEVVGNLSAPSRYYLLRVKGLTRAKSVKGRATPTPGLTRPDMDLIRKLPADAGAPAPEVLQAITSLKRELPGIGADPNWIRLPFGARAQDLNSFTPNDTYYDLQWDMRMINMPLAWATQATAKRTAIVAVIDSGVDITHPDFFRNGQSVCLPYINTKNAPTITSVPDISVAHGTHCAGTIGAVTNNGVGISGIAGYDGGGVSVKILPIQAGDEGFFDSALVTAILEAPKHGANVISMSLGGYGYSAAEQSAVLDAISAGVVVVCATGNDNINMSLDLYNNSMIGQTDTNGNPAWGTTDGFADQTYPSGFTGVLAVNAVGPTGAKSSFSNYGGLTGSIKMSAPGGDAAVAGSATSKLILSTVAQNIPSGYIPGYDLYQGTSMACPHVAGAATLLYAIGVAPADIVSTLINTANPVGTDTLHYGAGILDVGKAVSTFDPLPRIFVQGGTDITTAADTGVSRTTDLGSSYFRGINFGLSISGLNRYFNAVKADPTSTSITITIQTATTPSTVLQSYTVTPDQIQPLQSDETKISVHNVTVPGAPVQLGQGRYKAVATLTYQGAVIDSQAQFFEVDDYTQGIGLSLFSVPFQPTVASGVQQESQVLGISSGFAFKRFDPLNPLGKGGDSNDVYYTNQPGGTTDAYAQFATKDHSADPLHPERPPVPLAYGVSNTTTSVAPVGVGYWLNLGENRKIDTTGTPITEPVAVPLFGLEDDQGNSRGIDGWNLIGAPFPYAVNWNAVSVRQQTPVGIKDYSLADAIAAQIINAQLVAYDPQTRNYSYSVAPNGQLLPFRAYWVRALKDCTVVIPPTRVAQSATSRAATLVKTTRGEVSQVPLANGWRMRLAASVAGDRDAENYFGQTRGAKDGEDGFDVAKPPSGPSHAYVRFVGTNTRGKKAAYAFDMHPIQEGRLNSEWTVAVGADKGDSDVTVTWDGLGNLPTRAKLTLRDSVTGATVPMNSRSSYTYKNTEAGATRQFTISLKSENTSGPLQITNVRMASTRAVGAAGASASRGVNVRFALSQDADVQATVKSLSGKVVSTLTGASRAVAQSDVLLRWDGRSREGSEVAAGSYILEITARTDSGEVTTVKRPIAYLR